MAQANPLIHGHSGSGPAVSPGPGHPLRCLADDCVRELDARRAPLDHEPLTTHAFRGASRAGVFAFVWEAHGLQYGVRREELLLLSTGGWVVMNESREHLPQLQQRGREAAAECRARLDRGALQAAPDPTIVNDRRIEGAVVELDV